MRKNMCKVVINDVLPLKADRRNAIANLKSFGASAYQRLNFNRFIYIRYAAPRYSAGTIIIASVYGGWVKLQQYFSAFTDQR